MKFIEVTRFEFWTVVILLAALIVITNIYYYEHRSYDVKNLEKRIDSLNIVINDSKSNLIDLLKRNDTISIVINNYPINKKIK